MSNAQIRSWVYRAIGILILCSIAWYFLIRPSNYDSDYASQYFKQRKTHMQNVAQYLIDKNIETDVLDFPTIDNRYGILSEDTNEFRACNSSITTLLENEIKSIHSHNGVVTFVSEDSGGVFLKSHIEYAYVPVPNDRISVGLPLSESHWYYSIEESKSKD
ncbi:MAG: hypothetical protein IK130_05090 [Oscillospiraceae bacterium]|nr:hypothetical protein [Oscillospiraceae bacterium]